MIIYSVKYLLKLGYIEEIETNPELPSRGKHANAIDVYGEIYKPGEWSSSLEQAQAMAKVMIQRRRYFHERKLRDLAGMKMEPVKKSRR